MFLNKYQTVIEILGRVKKINPRKKASNEGMVQIILNDDLIYLSLKDIIDFKVEKQRLIKNLNKIDSEIEKIQVKLIDKNFIENAPDVVVDEQKERLENYRNSKKKIEFAIQSISS